MKGVGPRKFQLLNRLGIKTVEELLYYFPRRYEDRRHFTPISEIKSGNIETIKGEILFVRSRRTKRRLSIVQIAVTDPSGQVSAVWFNQPYLSKKFKAGDRIILHGKVEKFVVSEFQFRDNTGEVWRGAGIPPWGDRKFFRAGAGKISTRGALALMEDSAESAVADEAYLALG